VEVPPLYPPVDGENQSSSGEVSRLRKSVLESTKKEETMKGSITELKRERSEAVRTLKKIDKALALLGDAPVRRRRRKAAEAPKQAAPKKGGKKKAAATRARTEAHKGDGASATPAPAQT
jgi:hypothetical protein